jgi:hypothetical protein
MNKKTSALNFIPHPSALIPHPFRPAWCYNLSASSHTRFGVRRHRMRRRVIIAALAVFALAGGAAWAQADGGQTPSDRITVEVQEAARGQKGGRRPRRARRDRVEDQGRETHPRRRPGGAAQGAAGGERGRHLLRLTERSDQRPCGADSQRQGLQGARPRRRLAGVGGFRRRDRARRRPRRPRAG